MLGFLFAVIAGAAMSVQGVMNTRLQENIGLWEANAFVQGTAFVLSLAVMWIFGKGHLRSLTEAPWWNLLGGALGCDVYVANLFASLFAAAYAEVMARVRKCPAMPYLVIAILPLLPGAGVYYTMSLGLEGNRMDAVAKGLETVGIAGSLAVGILLVSTVFRLIYRHVQGARAEKS